MVSSILQPPPRRGAATTVGHDTNCWHPKKGIPLRPNNLQCHPKTCKMRFPLRMMEKQHRKKKLLFNRTKCSISNTLQNQEIWNVCIVHHLCHIFPNSTNLRMTRSWMVLIHAYGFAPGETTAQPNSFSVAHCSRIAPWSWQSLSFNES